MKMKFNFKFIFCELWMLPNNSSGAVLYTADTRRRVPRGRHRALACFRVLLFLLVASPQSPAQESYFITYSHQMEEPGNLEIANKSVSGFPRGGDAFLAHALELEYGVKAWWTSELYLDGQTTSGQSSVFTGFRWENRVRPLLREHWINPVLYVEFENINSADKSLLEVVGHDVRQDFVGRNDRSERKREAELKLILSSNFRGWNLSENIIAEKNLSNEPWEFGYALGMSRPLALAARAQMRSLPRKLRSGHRDVWRSRRPLQLWPARYVALSCATY
jgi:hypothetical protein